MEVQEGWLPALNVESSNGIYAKLFSKTHIAIILQDNLLVTVQMSNLTVLCKEAPCSMTQEIRLVLGGELSNKENYVPLSNINP